MFCGILPWTWFARRCPKPPARCIAGGNLIKKVLFPAEVLPLVNVLANMVHFFLGLTILVAFLIVYQRLPDPLGPGVVSGGRDRAAGVHVGAGAVRCRR